MIKLDYKEQGDRYIGLSSDVKPTDESVQPNSIFEELDTGGKFKYDGVAWIWNTAAKELDHNRMMLGLGLSYQVETKQSVPENQNLLVRFRTGNVSYHHAEKRTVGVNNSTCDLAIYRGVDWSALTAGEVALNINQKGLSVGGSLASFQLYGLTDDVTVDALISGLARLDGGTIFADSTRQTNATAVEPIISGRHYDPNDDLLILVRNVGSDDAEITYKYNWHEE